MKRAVTIYLILVLLIIGMVAVACAMPETSGTTVGVGGTISTSAASRVWTGESGNIIAYSFLDGQVTCYVTVSGGAIFCK